MTEAAPSTRTLYAVFAALMVLLALTAGASRLPLGALAAPVSLAIAFAKTALIFIYFMKLREQPGIVRVFALVGFFWLAIALTLTLADYLSRARG